MFRNIIIGAAAILLIGSAAWFLRDTPSVGAPVALASAKPWIEVARSRAYLVDAAGKEAGELRSGDEVAPGSTVSTDATGRAILHMPDGSVLRLDSNTTLRIEEFRYDAGSGALSADFFLVVGRVWSKVVALATPESSWEVETTSAVATVRGTAFSTEYKNGVSKVLGAENTVAVSGIDPATKERIPRSEVKVTERTLIEFKDADVAAVAKGEKRPETVFAFALKRAPAEALAEPWVKESLDEDKKLDDKVRVIKEKVRDVKEAREEMKAETNYRLERVKKLKSENKTDEQIEADLKKETLSAFKERLEKRLEEKREEGTGSENATSSPAAPKPGGTESSGGGSVAPEAGAAVLGLVIEGLPQNGRFESGQKVTLRATLIFSDGTKKDVTGSAVWKVTGFVGAMEGSAFAAKLRDEDAEFPQVEGAISASVTWEGAVITAPARALIVVPSIEETVPLG